MHFQKQIISLALVAALLALVFAGSHKEISQVNVVEDSYSSLLTDRSESIYFWYDDDSMTDFISRAAVEFGEQAEIHVIPILVQQNDYLELINKASVDDSNYPDAYILGHELIEKAYLAGLACEIQDDGLVGASNFCQSAVSAISYNGKNMAYPLCFETTCLLYNKDYLEDWAKQQAEKMAVNMAETAKRIQAGEEGSNENGEEAEELQGAEGDMSGEATAYEEAATQIMENMYGPIYITELTEAELEYFKVKLKEYFIDNCVPQTLGQLLNIADTYDAAEDVDCIFNWDVSDIFYNYWIIGNSINLGGETGEDRNAIELANDDTIAALEQYQNLRQFFSIESDTVSYSSVLDEFIAGKSVFTIVTTDAIATLESAKSDGVFDFDYGIAPMPMLSAEKDSRSMSITTAVVINGYSSHLDMANAFSQYLVYDKAEEIYGRIGKPSALKGLYGDDEYLAAFAEEYEDSISLPKILEAESFWMQLEVMMAKVWNGADIMETLSETQDTMDRLLEKYRQ